MRSAILLLALAVTDVARALGYIYEGNYDYLIVLLIAFIAMDIADFLRGKKNA